MAGEFTQDPKLSESASLYSVPKPVAPAGPDTGLPSWADKIANLNLVGFKQQPPVAPAAPAAQLTQPPAPAASVMPTTVPTTQVPAPAPAVPVSQTSVPEPVVAPPPPPVGSLSANDLLGDKPKFLTDSQGNFIKGADGQYQMAGGIRQRDGIIRASTDAAGSRLYDDKGGLKYETVPGAKYIAGPIESGEVQDIAKQLQAAGKDITQFYDGSKGFDVLGAKQALRATSDQYKLDEYTKWAGSPEIRKLFGNGPSANDFYEKKGYGGAWQLNGKAFSEAQASYRDSITSEWGRTRKAEDEQYLKQQEEAGKITADQRKEQAAALSFVRERELSLLKEGRADARADKTNNLTQTLAAQRQTFEIELSKNNDIAANARAALQINAQDRNALRALEEARLNQQVILQKMDAAEKAETQRHEERQQQGAGTIAIGKDQVAATRDAKPTQEERQSTAEQNSWDKTYQSTLEAYSKMGSAAPANPEELARNAADARVTAMRAERKATPGESMPGKATFTPPANFPYKATEWRVAQSSNGTPTKIYGIVDGKPVTLQSVRASRRGGVAWRPVEQ